MLFVGRFFIGFGSKLYRHILGIPMGTHCAPLVANLVSFYYEFLTIGASQVTLDTRLIRTATLFDSYCNYWNKNNQLSKQ